MTWRSWVKRSTSWQSASVTTPTGRPSATTTTAPCARLGSRLSASPVVSPGPSVIGVSCTRCRRFTQATTSATTVDRDVLRQHRDAATAGDGLGHPPPGNCGHVGDDDRNRGPAAIPRAQIDVEPGLDRAAARHHEDVTIGQVLRRRRVTKESHVAHPGQSGYLQLGLVLARGCLLDLIVPMFPPDHCRGTDCAERRARRKHGNNKVKQATTGQHGPSCR